MVSGAARNITASACGKRSARLLLKQFLKLELDEDAFFGAVRAESYRHRNTDFDQGLARRLKTVTNAGRGDPGEHSPARTGGETRFDFLIPAATNLEKNMDVVLAAVRGPFERAIGLRRPGSWLPIAPILLG